MKTDNKKSVDKIYAGVRIAIVMFAFVAGVHAKKDGPPPRVSEAEALSAFHQAYQMRKMADPTAAAWEPQGPYALGRINVVVTDPTDDQTIYVGGATGGVWKSTNGGNSYEQKFNDYDQSIGDIAIDPNNTDIIWVGGGENMYGGGSHTYPGTGVFKSTDGGETWQHVGLDSTFYISRISIAPGNSNTVFVAAQGAVWGKNLDRGVYRTTDGGETWTQVLGPRSDFIPITDDSTGATDVRVHPTNSNRVFATFFSAHRLPYARNWGGPSSRVWRSDDGGDTWEVLGSAQGLPTSDLGKSTMDFCLGTPNTAYLVYFTSANTLKNVYRSTDGGMTWSSTGSNPNSNSLYSYYAHTFGQIRVNPTNPNDVVVLGINSFRSTNGGSSWSQTLGQSGHVDHRSMAWSRTNGDLVYLGDDGGLKRGTSGPNGSMSNTGTGTNGINIAQIYSLDVAPGDDANYRYIGLQDNGGRYTTNGGQSWSQFIGGDGMQIRVNHGNPNHVLGCLQYGSCRYSTNRGSGAGGVSGYTGRKLWDAGLAFDSATGASYLGSQYVFRANSGSASYTRISNDLTNGDHSAANYPMGTVSAIAAHGNAVYAGTDDGNVWVRQNASASGTGGWTRIRNGDGTGPGTGDRRFDGWVKLIHPDYSVANGSSALIAISYWRWGHQYWKPSIYRVTNYGLGGVGSNDWTDISGDLPPAITTNKVVKDARGYLYAATDYGAYVSANEGVNWSWLGDDALPVVPVNDMVVHQQTNTLYIGTYGRGVWRIPLDDVVPVVKGQKDAVIQVLRNFPNPVAASTRIEFKVADAQALDVAVYDFTGRKLKELYNKTVQAGETKALTWDGTDASGNRLAKGNYILRAIGNKATLAKKISVE